MPNFEEIREPNAPPHVAAHYDDIKQATGIPQVNLIYRHLATHPGVLEWTWSVLGPAYRSGRIAERVPRLTAGLPPQRNVDLAEGLDADEAQSIANVLRFYNHAN